MTKCTESNEKFKNYLRPSGVVNSFQGVEASARYVIMTKQNWRKEEEWLKTLYIL